jgi:dihydrofolate synthase/folylpolyglutamate synthase
MRTQFINELNRLGNPQDKLNIIHIAGTNGKGSTINYLTSILVDAGFKVGTFTSPHIISEEERIRINFDFIPTNELTSILETIQGELTYFEKMFIASLMYFKNKTDYVIVEAGIGGTHDCTNIVNPIISAVTNVGLDHQDILGDTLEEIAKDKMGIQKDGVKTLVSSSINGNSEILMEYANDKTRLIEPNFR